jgi:hypothetical protein
MVEKGPQLELLVYQGTKVVGKLSMTEWAYAEKPSFLDYVLGGCEVSLIIGIDFTKSNGLPTEKDSLHSITSPQKNEYVEAISAVGEILQYYDSDKQIPVFGFGAKLPPYYDIVSHCFAMNGNIFDPEIKTIEEVLKVYYNAVTQVEFHGPTVFSQLLRTVIAYAEAKEVNQQNQQYFILLIITDGIINDKDSAIHEIVRASALPISIIIVGVGDEDFEQMKELDADRTPLYSKVFEKPMERDVVQFVPFSKYKGRPNELAKEVLLEVPEQLLSFMESRNIRPNHNQADHSTPLRTLNSFTTQNLTSARLLHPSSCLAHELFPGLKKELMEDVMNLGFERELIREVFSEGVPCMDVNMIINLINIKRTQRTAVQPPKRRVTLTPISPRVRPVSQTKPADSRSCVICQERKVDIVLVDCGHSSVCSYCLRDVDSVCPRCKTTFSRWVKILQ